MWFGARLGRASHWAWEGQGQGPADKQHPGIHMHKDLPRLWGAEETQNHKKKTRRHPEGGGSREPRMGEKLLGYPVQWAVPESSSTRWASGAWTPNTHERTLRHPGLLTSKVRMNSQQADLPGVGRGRKEDRVHHTVRAQEIAALGNRGSHGDNTAITPNFVNFIPHRSHCMFSGHEKYLMRNREPQPGSKCRGWMGAGTPPAARSKTCISASWGTCGPAHRVAVAGGGE